MRGVAGPAPRAATARGGGCCPWWNRTLTRGGAGARGAAGASPGPPASLPVDGACLLNPRTESEL